MLRLMEKLKWYRIVATDGEIGKVRDVLFDDAEWALRHIVVNTGGWFGGRSVLISPHSVEGIDEGAGEIRVGLTQQQVKDAPSTDTDRPVSRQFEEAYYSHFGYPYYWTGPYVWGPWMDPGRIPEREVTDEERSYREQQRRRFDPHLRSFNNVNGYKVEATDGAMGDIEDAIFDDVNWTMRYFVVDTRKLLPSKDVLLPPDNVARIDWEYSTVHLQITKQQLNNLPTFTSIEDIPDGATEVVSLERRSA